MNKLLSAGLLSLMIFVVSCTSDLPSGDNNWTGDNLRGKVKMVTEYSYQTAKEGEEWIKGNINQAYSVKTYSEDGFKLSERRLYSDSDQLQFGYDYIYDENGGIERINQVGPDGQIVAYSIIDKLEGKTSIIKYTDRFGSTLATSMPTGYTEMDWKNFKLMQTRAHQPAGELSTTVIYTYNDHGDIATISVDATNEQGQDYTIKSTYPEFDEQGNWTRMIKEYEGYPLVEMMERKYEYYEE